MTSLKLRRPERGSRGANRKRQRVIGGTVAWGATILGAFLGIIQVDGLATKLLVLNIVVAIGCVLWAVGKSRPAAWGLLFLGGPLGLIVLTSLPDRTDELSRPHDIRRR